MMLDATVVDQPAGRRILVVEDEMMIAILLDESLRSLGCTVVGPVGKLDAAIRLATDAAFDAAVLDINIRGGQVFPVAEILEARGIPYVLASGYSDWVLPNHLQGRPRLTKPFTLRELEHEVLLLCRRRARPDPAA
nr:response regulator [uncultured Rhodopila sp.]